MSTDKKPTVLVIGSGGREHALTWASVEYAETVIVAPGNGGSLLDADNVVVDNATSIPDIIKLAKDRKVDIVLVGPEAPLAEGLADALIAEGIACFGPRKAAARLEADKAYSKEFMVKYNIPTAKHQSFTDFAAAENYIRTCGHRVVVKASGLAAGKGVIVPTTTEEAVSAARNILVDREFGDAGSIIVVEEFLEGTEVSVLAFCDGTSVVSMPGAQDHKRRFEFDEGPNTGGMGAFAPSPLLTDALATKVRELALQPVVDGMKAEGTPYVGVLYAGLMVRNDGSFAVLEYNCRFGDPETQVLLPLLSTPLPTIALACARGTLSSLKVEFKKNVFAATVVAVAEGYPASYAKGNPIHFAPHAKAAKLTTQSVRGTHIFHAGTKLDASGTLVTNGGRVLAVTSLGPTLKSAVHSSYNVLEGICFSGVRYRRDISGPYVRPSASETPLRVAVLGSTRGSALAGLLAAQARGDLAGAEITLVVSNKSEAGILEKARHAGVDAEAIVPVSGESRDAYDTRLGAFLAQKRIDLIVLGGWMRILSAGFTARFAHRIINVHPSLLPRHAGLMDLAVHEAVLAAKDSVSGCTVHLVDAGVDTGSVLVQKACSTASETDPASFVTADQLKARVQALEVSALVEAIRLFVDDAPVDFLSAIRRYGNRVTPALALLPPERVPSAAALGALSRAKLTYAAAGVDIDAGESLVERIKPFAKATARSGADAALGGFGGLFDLKAAGYVDPLLVSGTDGVGTKLKVAQQAKIHSTVGIDLVAMSVNDIIVQGAEPLLFLDYFACGVLDVAEAASVVEGIARGCKDSGCALVGGETAEMPSMYAPGEYDLAGFAVGAVERNDVLPKLELQQPGDVLIGLASSGVHSNGFSLVRKVVEKYGLQWDQPAPFETLAGVKTLAEAVLTPTKLYVKSLLAVLRASQGQHRITGLAHITGGGLPENLPRVLRDDIQAVLDVKSWPILPIFKYMKNVGSGVDAYEMSRTFNCGIGMIAVVPPQFVDTVMKELKEQGEDVYQIGYLQKLPEGEHQVKMLNLDEAFQV